MSFILALHWVSNLNAAIRLRCSDIDIATQRATVRGRAPRTVFFHLAPNRSSSPSEPG